MAGAEYPERKENTAERPPEESELKREQIPDEHERARETFAALASELAEARESMERVLGGLSTLETLPEVQVEEVPIPEGTSGDLLHFMEAMQDEQRDESETVRKLIHTTIPDALKALGEKPIVSIQDINERAADIIRIREQIEAALRAVRICQQRQRAVHLAHERYRAALLKEQGFSSIGEVYAKQDTLQDESDRLGTEGQKTRHQVFGRWTFRDERKKIADNTQELAKLRSLTRTHEKSFPIERLGDYPLQGLGSYLQVFSRRTVEHLVEYWARPVQELADARRARGEPTLADAEWTGIQDEYIERVVRPEVLKYVAEEEARTRDLGDEAEDEGPAETTSASVEKILEQARRNIHGETGSSRGSIPYTLGYVVSMAPENGNREQWARAADMIEHEDPRTLHSLKVRAQAVARLREYREHHSIGAYFRQTEHDINESGFPPDFLQSCSRNHWHALTNVLEDERGVRRDRTREFDFVANAALLEELYRSRGSARSSIATNLGSFGQPESLEPLLLVALGDGDKHTSAYAAYALGELVQSPVSARALEEMRRLPIAGMNQLVTRIQEVGEREKTDHGSFDWHYAVPTHLRPSAEGLLLTHIRDSNKEAQRLAISGLGSSLHSARVNGVLAELAQEGNDEAIGMLLNRVYGVSLGINRYPDPSAAPHIASLLEHAPSKLQQTILEKMAFSDPEVTRSIFELLGTERSADLLLPRLSRLEFGRIARECGDIRITKAFEERMREGDKPSQMEAAGHLAQQFSHVTDSIVLGELLRHLSHDSFAHRVLASSPVALSTLAEQPEQRGSLLTHAFRKWMHTDPEGKGKQFDIPNDLGERITRMEGHSSLAALRVMETLRSAIENGAITIHEERFPAPFESLVSPRTMDHLEFLAERCPAAVQPFLEDAVRDPDALDRLIQEYGEESILVRRFVTKQESAPEPFDPRNRFRDAIHGLAQKLFLSPNRLEMLPLERQREILGDDLLNRIEKLASTAVATRAEEQILEAASDPDQLTRTWMQRQTELHVREHGSKNFQLPGGRYTYAQMLASRDLFEQGSPALYHGTTVSAARSITTGIGGVRMHHEKGSSGAYFSTYLGEVGFYAAEAIRAPAEPTAPGQAPIETERAIIDEPAVVVFSREALRNARTQLEPSYWPGAVFAGRAVDGHSAIVRIPQRAAMTMPLLHEYKTGDPMVQLADRIEFPSIARDVGKWLVIQGRAEDEGLAGAVTEKLDQFLLRDGKAKEVVCAIADRLKELKYPEPKIIEVVDEYLRFVLDASLPENAEKRALVERFQNDDRIDPALFHDLLAAHESLAQNLNPADSTERLIERIETTIRAEQRKAANEHRDLFVKAAATASTLERPDLAPTVKNRQLLMIGERNGERDIADVRANMREVAAKNKELRLIQARGIVERALEEIPRGEHPPEGTFSVAVTSSTARGEAALDSDYDLLVLVESDEVRQSHDRFFVELERALYERLTEAGFEKVDLGLMHRVGSTVTLDDLNVPLNRDATMMSHHVEPTVMLDLEHLHGEPRLVRDFKEKTVRKLGEEQETWIQYLETTQLVGLRRLFQEGASQLLSGDAPSDVKTEFMRILPFEIYYELSKHLDELNGVLAREGKTVADLPVSTLDRFELLEKMGVIDGERRKRLQEAFQDITLWRFRTGVLEGKSHAELDPMMLTLAERERFLKHIEAIREFVSMSEFKLDMPPRVVT